MLEQHQQQQRHQNLMGLASEPKYQSPVLNHPIHPNYVNCAVTCSCGNAFETRSTVATLKVEICGQCHPFYTGRQKFVDTAGRIQRFQEKYKWHGDVVKEAAQKKKVSKPAKVVATGEDDDF